LFALALWLSGPSIPDSVKATITRCIDNGDNAGVVVGIVDAGGDRTYAGFGVVRFEANGTPGAAPDEHTVFEIGSITKVFTSLVLATMVLDHSVALDDPVAKYLPPSVTVPSRNGKQIQLVHLATHQSGLPRLPTNMTPQDPLNPYADYTVELLYEF